MPPFIVSERDGYMDTRWGEMCGRCRGSRAGWEGSPSGGPRFEFSSDILYFPTWFLSTLMTANTKTRTAPLQLGGYGVTFITNMPLKVRRTRSKVTLIDSPRRFASVLCPCASPRGEVAAVERSTESRCLIRLDSSNSLHT